MNEELCLERHKRVDEKMELHDYRLNNHAERLDRLEQYKTKTEAVIEGLCNQIEQLVTVMKWFIGLLLGSFVGFFFYAVQHNIFK